MQYKSHRIKLYFPKSTGESEHLAPGAVARAPGFCLHQAFLWAGG